VLFSVLGLYLHYYCYMVNLAIGVHALLTLRGRDTWRHFAALNALTALAFLPWIMIVIHQFVLTPVDTEVLTIHGMPLNRETVEYLGKESLGTPLALNLLLLGVGALGPLIRTPGPMSRVPRARRLSGALLAVLWFGLPLPRGAENETQRSAPVRLGQAVALGALVAACVFMRGPGSAFIYFQF